MKLLARMLITVAVATISTACNSPEPQAAVAVAAKSSGESASLPPVAADAGEPGMRIFVSNYRADTISVVEGNPGMEVKAIPGGDSPHGMALRPTQPRLLAVANSTGSGVTFIDPETLENKQHVATSGGPQDLVFSLDGHFLYVISPTSFDLHVIDVDAMTTVGEPTRFHKKPRRILTDASGKRLFVLLVDVEGKGTSAEIAVMNAATREIEKRIPVGRHPDAMAIGNKGRTLASASFDDSTISVIDTDTLEVVATHPALTGMGLAIHPDKAIAYSMESFDDVIQILDLETGAEIKTISAGAWPTFPTFGPSGRYLYIPHEDSDSIVKLDTETNEVVAKIAVGREPIEVAIFETGGS